MNKIETIKRTINEFGRAQVILFGSRVLNADSRFSDYDILAIFSSRLSKKEKINIATQIRKKMAERLIDVDIIIRNKTDIEREKNQTGSIIKEALKEGKII